uniref:Uncharacterized protein n=1 Tax=Plectus sambesii TaxID=2011161 RepID=A0A914UJC6_9BILA
MLTALGFTLLYTSSLEKNAAADIRGTVHNYRVAAEYGDAQAQFYLGLMYENEKPLNKEMHLASGIWEICMKMVKVCLNRMKKLSNGTENQQNKGMLLRKVTWELCMNLDKGCLNHMKKL